MQQPPPLEHDEAIVLVEWCGLKKVPLWHIPQETYTKSKKVKQRNKEAGVRPGIADYVVFTRHGTLWIELKRGYQKKNDGELGASPSSVDPAQKKFIEMVCDTPGSEGIIAYGADEAIKFIEKYTRP